MKRGLTIGSLLTLAAGLIWVSRPAKGDDLLSTLPFEDIKTGYHIAPVPLNLVGKDPFLVG